MRRLCVYLFLITLPVLAQDRAAINGTVTDASGALVPGAAVELKSPETGLRRAALTDEGGRYQITPLPVGSYVLTISHMGFKPTTVNQIDLQYGETRTIDAHMEVGGATETVVVSAT